VILIRFVAIMIGLAAFLCLPVLGWGGFSAFLSHPALAAIVIATFGLGAVALFAGGNISPGQREDRGNRWVLVAFTVIGLMIGYLPAYTDRIGLLTIDGGSLRWTGVALYIIGGALRLWPVFVLGNRFSGLVAIQAGHTLVTSGIYGVIRHPSYLGLLINVIGWALAFRSGVGLLLSAAILAILVGRIRAEERLLHSQFGTEYDAYRAHTSRLIPGIY
jgi:protein-S-isoprenylcysteine O-methyltransferase Ste14